MNLPEAVQLQTELQLADRYARARSVDEQRALAAQTADVLKDAPLDWAIGQVREGIRAGNTPTLQDLAVAWRAEARRRVEAVEIPQAPAEIEDDPARWREWEIARRAAIMAGAPQRRAIEAANRSVGYRGVERQITGRAAPVAHDAKSQVLANMREWSARQARERAALDLDGGEA